MYINEKDSGEAGIEFAAEHVFFVWVVELRTGLMDRGDWLAGAEFLE